MATSKFEDCRNVLGNKSGVCDRLERKARRPVRRSHTADEMTAQLARTELAINQAKLELVEQSLAALQDQISKLANAPASGSGPGEWHAGPQPAQRAVTQQAEPPGLAQLQQQKANLEADLRELDKLRPQASTMQQQQALAEAQQQRWAALQHTHRKIASDMHLYRMSKKSQATESTLSRAARGNVPPLASVASYHAAPATAKQAARGSTGLHPHLGDGISYKSGASLSDLRGQIRRSVGLSSTRSEHPKPPRW